MKNNKNYSIMVLLMLTCFSCKLSQKTNNYGYDINVSFDINDMCDYENCNDVSIDFAFDNNLYRGKLKGCRLSLPTFPNNADYIDIIFKKDNYNMRFSKIKVEWLYIEQNMNWNFKVLTQAPFDELNNSELNVEDIDIMYYMQFIPLEYGQAIEVVSPVLKKTNNN